MTPPRKDPRVDDPSIPPRAQEPEFSPREAATPIPTSLAQRVTAAYEKAKSATELANGAHRALAQLGRRMTELELSLGRRIRDALARVSDSQVDADEAKVAAKHAELTAATTASVVTTTIIEERRPFARWQSHVFVAILTVAGAVAVESYRECRAGPSSGARPIHIEQPEAE